MIRSRDLSARSVDFYNRGIARIEERWAGGGEPGLRFLDDAHLYARDLDIFGTGSLFELLSTARTRAGEDVLAHWLKAPSPPTDVRNRQQAVEELRDRLDFREAMELAGAPVRSIDTASLTSWATGRITLRRRWPRMVAYGLAGAAIGSVIWWGLTGSPVVFMATLVIELLFAWAFRSRVEQVLHGVESPSRALDVLAQALVRIEQEPVASKRLTQLRSTLGHGAPASAAIRRLHRLVELHDWQHNQFFGPIAFLLMWSMQVAWALESWRRQHGSSVPVWIETLGEHEALMSLAAYAYEHPSDPFPTLRDEGPSAFHGVGLRHPLVPADRMVANDVRLDDDVRLFVVSGSNMSGKSTLLRTVGINAVLALAGAPVRAERLELTFLRLGATLRIEDSLRAGRSRFYAEIARIREVADLAKDPVPLLFLFDELFQGTNSSDRAAAAAVALRTLVERHAIGLVTTHDLALTRLVDDLGGRAVNVHFEDRFDRGELTFDYRLRPGPATRGNALALLKMVGLQA
ncbi:MAG: MutS-related protein [Vicinamibacterales bacterium]